MNDRDEARKELLAKLRGLLFFDDSFKLPEFMRPENQSVSDSLAARLKEVEEMLDNGDWEKLEALIEESELVGTGTGSGLNRVKSKGKGEDNEIEKDQGLELARQEARKRISAKQGCADGKRSKGNSKSGS